MPQESPKLHDKTSGYAMFARWSLFAIFVTGFLVEAPVASASEVTYTFNIPAEALADTLRAIGQETAMNIVFAPETVGDARAPAVQGELTAEQAVIRALSKTKLRVRKATANSILIEPSLTGLTATPVRASGVSSQRAASDPPGSQVEPMSAASPAVPSRGDPEAQSLQEVVVTAQKKSQRLLDVPVPVSVLDTADLAANGQSRLQDYFAQVPGLSLTSNNGGGWQTLAIRGVTTGVVANPTVGIMIDDVPFGSSTSLGNGSVLIPDIDPGDLARIEVLKGPQGTLYGADSMGGLVKFVTLDPTTDRPSGRVEVLGDHVDQGESGYAVRGAANVPLADDLAFRASGFVRRDPGYVDNVLANQNNSNRVNVYGGLLSALWRPSDALSLKIDVLLQNTYGDGTPAIDATLDPNGYLHPIYGYQKQARLRGTEQYYTTIRLYSATVKAKIGSLEFTSITGYGDNKNLDVSDYTSLYGTPSDGPFFSPTRKLTQEIRLSSSGGRTLDWLAGAFYTHENSPVDLPSNNVDPTTGAQTGLLIDYYYPSTLTEYALFGDVTFHITDRLDLQIGGRESKNRQTSNETDTGPLVPAYDGFPSPFVYPTERTSGSAFTYLFTPEFKISRNFMVYARLTSGYRLGGPNLGAVVYNLPVQYGPDKTTNWELGTKGSFFDGALTLDASAYYIDWKQIQIVLTLPNGRYNANGGNAKSQGLEFTMQARPARGLTISANASLNDARLTQDLPPESSAFGYSGERLPYSEPYSGSLSVDQEWPLVRDWVGFVGGRVSYVGAREGEFRLSLSVPRIHFPAYTEADLRVGVRDESWVVNLFVNNVANVRGIVGGGGNYAQSAYNIFYVQPRTVGASLVKSF
jgi:iron complex outermembrane recepter protein